MGAWRCTVIDFQHQILKTNHVFNTTGDQEYKIKKHLCIIGTKKAKYIWNYSKMIWIWMNTVLNPEIGPKCDRSRFQHFFYISQDTECNDRFFQP